MARARATWRRRRSACASLAEGAATPPPGTAAEKGNWNAFLDAQAAPFKQINGAVIWRPFAAFFCTGHFGSQFTPAQFQQFWIYTYNYMHSKGVNNVPYAFAPPPGSSKHWRVATPPALAPPVPGSAHVDLTATEFYPPGEVRGNVSTAVT